MASLNRCEFIGNLGKDPEIRSMQSGDKVANFSIACTEHWRNKSSGERQEKTTWVPVVIFGKLAETAEKYLTKGSKVYIAGQFNVRKWQDKDGKDRYSTEIVLQGFNAQLIMLDGKERDDGPVADRGRATAGQAPADLGDDIPFMRQWQ